MSMVSSTVNLRHPHAERVHRAASLSVGQKEAIGKQDRYTFEGSSTQLKKKGCRPEVKESELIKGDIKVLRPKRKHHKTKCEERPRRKKLRTCPQPEEPTQCKSRRAAIREPSSRCEVPYKKHRRRKHRKRRKSRYRTPKAIRRAYRMYQDRPIEDFGVRR